MIDPTKLPQGVLAALRCRFGDDADDAAADARIAQLDPAQAFREFCAWNGLPGSWGDILMDALRGCEAAAYEPEHTAS
jgi:hypothetical protein